MELIGSVHIDGDIMHENKSIIFRITVIYNDVAYGILVLRLVFYSVTLGIRLTKFNVIQYNLVLVDSSLMIKKSWYIQQCLESLFIHYYNPQMDPGYPQVFSCLLSMMGLKFKAAFSAFDNFQINEQSYLWISRLGR